MEDSTSNIIKSREKKRFKFRLHFILLILAGMCIFLTETHNAAFTPGGLYSGVSVHGITLSKNLVHNEQHFFMFTSKELRDGKKIYNAYNRFPVFPFLLIGLFTHPFEYNPVVEIYIARQLMNIFFFLSIIVAFKLVDELVKNRYLALSVALVSFSSYYMLSYNNMIFNDIPALLGFVIALYGTVLLPKKRLKFRHILFFSLFPVCLGWQPYAVYMVWLLIDASELFVKKGTSFINNFQKLIRQPSFIITGIAIIWGITILGLQLLNEWRIVGGSFTSIPSFNSALWRSGIISSAGHTQYQQVFSWIPFLTGEAHSITIMFIPFFPIFQVEPGYSASVFLVISLIIYVLIKYFKDRNTVNRTLIIMMVSGLFWSIPMRHFVALHEFQSIFYVGFTISIYILLLSRMNPKLWKYLAIDITLIFLVTVALSNHFKTPDSAMNKMIPQFQNICNRLPANSKIYFDGDRRSVIRYSKFAVDYFLVDYWFSQKKDADYVISENPDYNGVKLTSNAGFNLYKIKDKKITSSLKDN